MWKLKLLAQFVLAESPGGERINYLLQRMFGEHSPEKFGRQIAPAVRRLVAIGEHVRVEGSTVVEIGTGWNAAGAVLFHLMGARAVHTYDHVAHVRYQTVRTALDCIEDRVGEICSITSIPEPTLREKLRRLRTATSAEEIFERAGVSYRAPGDAARTGLPAGSVDLIYSNAVLEHVPEEAIDGLMVESKRILRPGGIVYHRIGLHDHYAGFDKNVSRVNFLKFSEAFWAFFVKNKISYHNRLRERQFIDIFKAHGARIVSVKSETNPEDLERLKTMRIDERFAGMSHAELAVFLSEIVFSF